MPVLTVNHWYVEISLSLFFFVCVSSYIQFYSVYCLWFVMEIFVLVYVYYIYFLDMACKIWGSCSDVADNLCLMVYDTMLFGE
jgi:hypothetical protein